MTRKKTMVPETENQLAEMIAATNVPLRVQGGGTRGVRCAGMLLSTAGLRGIELYEPGALTIVAKAGTPLAEIETALAAENQQLAFEPMDHRALLKTGGEPTIGGVVAGNISGPRRIQAGACRDFLLGVRYVDGTGTVIKNGGRVMKNVTGYDLVKLMAGSWGTLGVLTQVSLKVLPRPETQATVMVYGCHPVDAVKVMSAALGSPFEVTGAAYDPASKGDPAVLIRIEGFAESVSYRASRLAALLSPFGQVETCADPDRSGRAWKDLRDVQAFAGQPGDVWRLSVKPTDAPAIAERLGADRLLFDWGGGLIWALVPEGTDLRDRAGQIAGHATIVRAGAETRAQLGMFHPQLPALAAINDGLRARFDPRGVLNSGLMGRQSVGA